MKEIQNSKIKNIVTINAYENKYYVLHNSKKLKYLKQLSYNSSNFVASYVNNRDLISTNIELSRSIPYEDIQDIIEIKAYEEFGLDQASEYIVKYFAKELKGDAQVYDIFVVKLDILKETFGEIVDETKYIDLLLPSPLLYRSLYNREMLAANGIHCFIYFGMYDSFVTFYRNSEYLYAKSIPYSLEEIYEQYCELAGERVVEDEFFKILESEGLKSIHTDYQDNFMKLFGEIFIAINDIIIYAKRAFDLRTIDQIFIGGTNGPIIGLDEYSENYLGLQSLELNFNFNFEFDEWYPDQVQCMLAVASLEFMENSENFTNLTIFQRPPAFHKRTSGQFIITISMAIMLGISYPSYFLIRAYINSAKSLALSQKELQLRKETDKYKAILGKKKREINKLNKEISDLSKVFHSKEKTLLAIYDKKVNYDLKSELLYSFANDISRFGVSVDALSSKKNSFVFFLMSKDEKQITKLIKYLSTIHFDKIKSINIEKISKNRDDEYYTGTLKVVLR